MIEKINEQDLAAFTAAQTKMLKAANEAKIAELELKNTILLIYNKYDLKVGQDKFTESGEVVRKPREVVVSQTEELVEDQSVGTRKKRVK